MRSKTAQRILSETSEEVKDKVRLEGYKRAKKICWLKRWFPFIKNLLPKIC